MPTESFRLADLPEAIFSAQSKDIRHRLEAGESVSRIHVECAARRVRAFDPTEIDGPLLPCEQPQVRREGLRWWREQSQ